MLSLIRMFEDDPSARRWSRRGWARVTIATVAVVYAAGFVWAVEVGQLARSHDRYAAYWSEPRGQPGGLLYVALGDSAAQSIGASRPERGYVGLVAARLAAASGKPVQVVNLSRSGAHVRDVLREQIPLLAGMAPDLVTVDVGGNDILHTDPAELGRLVTALVAALPVGAVVADIPYFMHGRWQREAAASSAMLREEAHGRGLPVAEVHQAMRAEGFRSMFRHYAADWFHLNDAGHQVWADAFWSALTSSEPLRRRLLS
ncbi:MAG TPA: SGNH/GDSL hydrolase family protein [Cryptosporangiaceae bacterium]|nr:SGNH/GDSL hydrolase family protein [Cryptosporangiaceae bacterium]